MFWYHFLGNISVTCFKAVVPGVDNLLESLNDITGDNLANLNNIDMDTFNPSDLVSFKNIEEVLI